jgi:hypothetical protein
MANDPASPIDRITSETTLLTFISSNTGKNAGSEKPRRGDAFLQRVELRGAAGNEWREYHRQDRGGHNPSSCRVSRVNATGVRIHSPVEGILGWATRSSGHAGDIVRRPRPNLPDPFTCFPSAQAKKQTDGQWRANVTSGTRLTPR